MKEKDLEKNLDNLIIDGLIKEAEQDNADFETAMRRMSKAEFEDLIYESAYAVEDRASELAAASVAADMYEPEESEAVSLPIRATKSRWKIFRPWITSAVAAAAVILLVLIPSINVMNGKLCDSALYASEAYMTASKGVFDISNASDEELRSLLLELESRYKDCIKEDGKLTYYTDDLQEAGWDLTLVYLKLHKKGDAVKVLKVLAKKFKGTPFGDHCKQLLETLN